MLLLAQFAKMGNVFRFLAKPEIEIPLLSIARAKRV
jgi:hypothetical protein